MPQGFRPASPSGVARRPDPARSPGQDCRIVLADFDEIDQATWLTLLMSMGLRLPVPRRHLVQPMRGAASDAGADLTPLAFACDSAQAIARRKYGRPPAPLPSERNHRFFSRADGISQPALRIA
jgi:hypothetical protein